MRKIIYIVTIVLIAAVLLVSLGLSSSKDDKPISNRLDGPLSHLESEHVIEDGNLVKSSANEIGVFDQEGIIKTEDELRAYFDGLTDYEFSLLIKSLNIFNNDVDNIISKSSVRKILEKGQSFLAQKQYGQLITNYFKKNKNYKSHKIICSSENCLAQLIFENIDEPMNNQFELSLPRFSDFCQKSKLLSCLGFGEWQYKDQGSFSHYHLVGELRFDIGLSEKKITPFNINPDNIVRLKGEDAIQYISKDILEQLLIVEANQNYDEKNKFAINDIYCEQERCLVSVSNMSFSIAFDGKLFPSFETLDPIPYCSKVDMNISMGDGMMEINYPDQTMHCIYSMEQSGFEKELEILTAIDNVDYPREYNPDIENFEFTGFSQDVLENSAIITSRTAMLLQTPTVFYPYMFNDNRSPLFENKVLQSLIYTSRYSTLFESLLSDGYIEGQGRFYSDQLSQEYVDSMCAPGFCILFTKEYGTNSKPCRVLKNKLPTLSDCRQTRFNNQLTKAETYWMTVVDHEEGQLNQEKTYPGMVDKESLIEEGKLEEILSLYIETQFATMRLRAKAPVQNISSIKCTENRCQVDIENGYFGTELRGQQVTRLQLDLRDICELLNPNVEVFGGGESNWECVL